MNLCGCHEAHPHFAKSDFFSQSLMKRRLLDALCMRRWKTSELIFQVVLTLIFRFICPYQLLSFQSSLYLSSLVEWMSPSDRSSTPLKSLLNILWALYSMIFEPCSLLVHWLLFENLFYYLSKWGWVHSGRTTKGLGASSTLWRQEPRPLSFKGRNARNERAVVELVVPEKGQGCSTIGRGRTDHPL